MTEALRALGNAFLEHPANEHLRTEITAGTLSAENFFQELLRLVYRLLFLFTAEDRGLLHSHDATEDQRAIYREGYGLARLRHRALRRRHYDRHADLWEGLRILFRSLSAGAPPLGLSALGGLFASDQCATLDSALIRNASLLEAVRALAYFRSGASLVRVNYRDMGTEELGSVYESLLELHPYLHVESMPWTLGFVGQYGAKAKGSARKLTGSYYTPASLVNELIKSALDPVIAQTVAAHRENPRSALLALRIVDPACGSGHFLLAAARRMAAAIARLEAGVDAPDETARQHALREVVQYCIYGVDRNPLAVELCKAALWIETVEPGRPLTFLDPHVRCGDSLVGILDPSIMSSGIPDEAYTPLTGDDKTTCLDLKRRNRQSTEAIQGDLFDQQGLKSVGFTERAFEEMPENTLAEITAKRSAWEAAQSDARRLQEDLRANLYVGAFFAPKTRAKLEVAPLNEDLNRLRRGMAMRPGVQALAYELAEHHRFFHWHVAFADIMQRGGFDVVLGNPPWERVKLQEKEFFEQRSPTIAGAANKAARESLILALIRADAAPGEKALHHAFQDAKREAEASSQFIRSSGRFPLTGFGDVNTYAPFAECSASLKSVSGRAGIIVPTQLGTADTTSRFFADLVQKGAIISFLNFFEIRQWFKGTDDRNPFGLLTMGNGASSGEFAFSLLAISDLQDQSRRFGLSAHEIALVNPNTKTAPIFRSRMDAELTRRIYSRVPVLFDEAQGSAGNPWAVSFMAMFHMSNDSDLFRTAAQLSDAGFTEDKRDWIRDGQRYVPLYEAKMINQFDHRASTFAGMTKRPKPGATLPRPSLEDRADPTFEVTSWYWVPESQVDGRLSAKRWNRPWLMGWRDSCRFSDERTLISSVIHRVGCGDKFLLIQPHRAGALDAVALVACLNSLVCDYIVRQKLSGASLKYYILKQLPIIPPSAYSDATFAFIIPRVVELTYTSEALRPFARDLSYDGSPCAWDPERRPWLRAELDAYYSRLYGLTRHELRYILDPCDAYGPDCPSETFRVLKEREVREYGEYRTARLVLRAWDQQEESLDR